MATKDLPLVVEVVEELGNILGGNEAKDAGRKRLAALAAKAKQAGFEATCTRALDSFTRSGLPPGQGR